MWENILAWEIPWAEELLSTVYLVYPLEFLIDNLKFKISKMTSFLPTAFPILIEGNSVFQIAEV